MAKGQRSNGIQSPYPPQEDLTLKRDLEEMPIVKEIIKIVASQADDLPIGSSVSDDAKHLFFLKMVEDRIMPLLVEKNFKIYDLIYLQQSALESFDRIMNIIQNLLELSTDKAQCLKWGLKSINDLRIGQVNEVLNAAEKEKTSGAVDKSSIDESKQ